MKYHCIIGILILGGGYNFGDLLSKYIVERISGKKVKWCHRRSLFKFCAVGSLVSDKLLRYGGVFWGTGMHDSSVRKHFAPCYFTAVRGPLTRRSLLDAGYKCPDVYGDPALLMPLLYEKKVTKKYKLGIICHFQHKEKLKFSDDVLVIDISRDEKNLLSFIDEVCQCEKILSSSLHGIIISNAYGIPAKYFYIDNINIGGERHKKFIDYFLSVQMPNQIPLCINPGTLITSDMKFDIDMTVDLKIDLKKLMETFPFS